MTSATSSSRQQSLAIGAFIVIASAYWISLWLPAIPGNWVLKFTPMLIAAAILARSLQQPYAAVMALGFVAAAGGDLFLALERHDYFVQGLSCFLITQIAYALVFFGRRESLRARWIWWLPIPLFGLGVFILLMPSLDRYLIPVAIYVTALVIMAVGASLVGSRPGRIYVGAWFFVLSDALIGIDRFLYSFDHSLKVIIATYFIAQYLIFTGCLRALPQR